ncbi:MAG: tRNA (N6-isopentenyl adenosine(37)-C2)-methylthiotransferase MiaB [Pseudomonadota bacterium]
MPPETELTKSTAAPSKKVFIKTYGCQMNVYDSERMMDALSADGYSMSDSVDDADLVLLNTCHIREKAAEKVYSEIGRLRKVKATKEASGQAMTIGVTGCVAQAEGEEIVRRADAVDLVVGPQTYHRLADLVREARKGNVQIDTDYAVEDKFEHLPAPEKKQIAARGVTAFLTVQEGCDKFCTFCVVPYTRGAEVSRSSSQIREEAKRLCDAGVREVTLLGQNVNAWHGEGPDGKTWDLGDLLHDLSDIDGLDRLRYVTSHPCDMSDRLIEAHRDIDILMPYLHLPVQSGSDAILKAMNRHHTRQDYLEIIDRVRAARPDIAISGDFIVGFPGESDADFEDTMSIVRETNYAQAFSFKYSQRPGTPGAKLENQVDESVKSERLTRLQALLNEQQLAFNTSIVGKTISILLEKPGRMQDQLIGRSPWLQSVIVDQSAGSVGDIVDVEITNAGPNSLMGKPLASNGK